MLVPKVGERAMTAVNKKNEGDELERKNDQKIAQLLEIIERLDQEFTLLLEEELSELELISRFTDSVEEKLKAHYAPLFPKKCNNCGTIYESREAFIQATFRLAKVTTIFDEIGLQEYRNCPCGSTLIVWTNKDRRDNSDYGRVRRELFDKCLTKLIQMSGRSEEEMEAKLRKIFSCLSS